MQLSTGSGSEVNPLLCCQWKREQDFDLQLLERAAQGDRKDKEDGWLKVQATPVLELDLEPQDYDLDISREVRTGASFVLPRRHQAEGRYVNRERLETIKASVFLSMIKLISVLGSKLCPCSLTAMWGELSDSVCSQED